jgi:hypothetical protein
MSVFNKVASLQYKTTTGGLPAWVYLFVFIGILLYTKFGYTYQDPETGETKNMGWILSTFVALIVTVFFAFGEWIRQGMFKARKKLFKNQGFSDPAGAAYQAQRMDNLSSQISAIKQ